MSSVRWLVAVTVGIVASFVGSTLYIETRVALVDDEVRDIVRNATPSIEELAAARTEMRHYELGVGRYIGARVQGVSYPRQRLVAARAAIDDHLETYSRLPQFEGEAARFDELIQARTRLYAAGDRTLDRVDAGDIDGARAEAHGAFDAAADALDRSIQQLLAFNAGHANDSGRTIDRIRRDTSVVVLVLDVATLLMAAGILTLAIRAMRLHERILCAQNEASTERANELDHFAARVAHDLKAPLTSVMMGVSAAQQYPQDAPRLLDRVRRASGTMNSMIDALLDFARAGAKPQRGAAAQLAPVVDAVVLAAQPSLAEAHAELIVAPMPSDCAVACSSGALASVLSNLVQNAVKYLGTTTAERRVNLDVRAGATTVRIEVADTGPGIPADIQDSIFEMYVRAPSSATKPGLGLGLATVKRLVEAHGGKLGVQSLAGQGARFWIELARASQVKEPAATASHSAAPSTSS